MTADAPPASDPPEAGSRLTIEQPHWRVPGAEPTTLLVFCGGDSRPQRDVVVERLIEHGAAHPARPMGLTRLKDVHWQQELSLPCTRGPVALWCEQARAVPAGTFGDAAVEAAGWVVGVQTTLLFDDPASSYAELMRVLKRAWADSPGVLDLDTNMCHPRSFVDEQLSLAEAPAPTDWLWRVNAMSRQVGDQSLWLRTSGLNRCSKVELEMFHVPAESVDAAAALIDLLAEQMFEDDLPEPGVTFEAGPGLRMALRSSEDVRALIEADAPGGAAMRKRFGVQMEPPSAVLTASIEPGRSAPSAQPPIDVLRAIESGAAAVYRTTRATARRAAMARARWGRFVEHWNAGAAGDSASGACRYLVQAAIPPGAHGHVERVHQWFEVESIDVHGVRGRPAHGAADTLPREERFLLDPAGLSDWLIVTLSGSITPANVAMECRT